MPLEGRQNPLIKIKNYEDWPYKIIYASDGVLVETAFRTIDTFYKVNKDIPHHKRPNIIHVCAKYSIVRVEKGASLSDGTILEENSFWPVSDPSDAYALLRTILEVQLRLDSTKHLNYNYLELVNKLPV